MDATGICLYCGAGGELTDDHVPPKNLFPKPRMGLVEVRACMPCNRGASKDDEYFRQCLVLAEQTRGHLEATKGRAPVFRSLNREVAPGLQASFGQSMRRVTPICGRFSAVTKNGHGYIDIYLYRR